MKKFYMSKTIGFNVLAFVVAVAAAFGYAGDLPSEWSAFVPAVIALINVLLRFVTKEEVTL